MKIRTVFLMFMMVVSYLILTSGCSEESAMINNAKKRVTEVLKGILETRTNSAVVEERSICKWSKDVNTPLSIPDFGNICDQFDSWRQEADIFPTIESFTVTNGYLINNSKPPTVIVEGTINNAPFKMRVPEKEQITWEEIPQFGY